MRHIYSMAPTASCQIPPSTYKQIPKKLKTTRELDTELRSLLLPRAAPRSTPTGSGWRPRPRRPTLHGSGRACHAAPPRSVDRARPAASRAAPRRGGPGASGCATPSGRTAPSAAASAPTSSARRRHFPHVTVPVLGVGAPGGRRRTAGIGPAALAGGAELTGRGCPPAGPRPLPGAARLQRPLRGRREDGGGVRVRMELPVSASWP